MPAERGSASRAGAGEPPADAGEAAAASGTRADRRPVTPEVVEAALDWTFGAAAHVVVPDRDDWERG